MEIRRLLFVGVVGAVVLLVAACGGGGSGDDSHKYPEQVRSNFMNSCTSAGATGSQCSCAFDKVEAKYTLSEFEQLEKDLMEGRRANELAPIIVECQSR